MERERKKLIRALALLPSFSLFSLFPRGILKKCVTVVTHLWAEKRRVTHKHASISLYGVIVACVMTGSENAFNDIWRRINPIDQRIHKSCSNARIRKIRYFDIASTWIIQANFNQDDMRISNKKQFSFYFFFNFPVAPFFIRRIESDKSYVHPA